MPMASRKTWSILGLFAAVCFAAGWGAGERSAASQNAPQLASQTVQRSQIKIEDFVYEGKPRGQLGLYVNGPTPGTRNLVAGVFHLKPGEEPHPIHTHADEEILIVSAGQGEIHCDGKVTKVGPGSVMYTRPDAPHGIKNSGSDVMTFYFVKWIGR